MVALSKLTVKVRNPDTVFFEGEPEAVSSANEKGPFDILPMHENFISLIKDKIIIHISGKDQKELAVKTGVIRAKSNSIQIFYSLMEQDR